AAELDAGAGVDSGRHLEREGSASAHPALTRALQARVGDDRAEALARDTGPAGHDLAQEGALDLLDLPPSVADLALAGARAGLRALARAGGADDGGVDGQVVL